MILIIDNYDSFTYNLYQYLGEMGYEMQVIRNDGLLEECIEMDKPTHIIISPGPGRPANAGKTIDIIKKYAGRIPVLGVCLGHQAIAEAFGGMVVKADKIVHGKQSHIMHDNSMIFKGLPTNIVGGRYHSLIVDRKHLPKELVVTAWTEDDEIMGIRHTQYPVYGLQFHPESIMTLNGKEILSNFLNIGGDFYDENSN